VKALSVELKIESLEQAFEEALEAVFSAVPFEERLEVTKRTLAPFALPEDLVLEAARPGAFNSYTSLPGRLRTIHFTRYGALVLQAREGMREFSTRASWAREGAAQPLAEIHHFLRHLKRFPEPLLEGTHQALALLAEGEKVKPPPPLPENTIELWPPIRAEVLVLVVLRVLVRSAEGPYLRPRVLYLGREAALLVDPTPEGDPPGLLGRKNAAWKLLVEAAARARSGHPVHLSEEVLAALLEGEGLPGSAALEALLGPRLYRLLKLSRS
jgi:hypothetical protein